MLLAAVAIMLVAAASKTITSITSYDSVAEMAANHNPAGFFKTAHARGYYTPGDGGGGTFAVTNSVTGTNLGTRIKCLLGGGTHSLDRIDPGPAKITWFGAVPGSGNDTTALTNALAYSADVILPQGIWDFGTDLVVSQTNRLVVEAGALIRCATNITMTVRGYFDAPLVKVIDTTHWVEGKGVIFNTLGAGEPITRTTQIYADWWGPSPNNPSGSDTKLFRAFLYSTPANMGTPKLITEGVYRVDAPLAVSNRWVIRGIGRPQINFAPTNSNVALFEVSQNSADVEISNVIFVSTRTSATNSFTNLFGIKIAPDCDRFAIRRNQFTLFNGGGIHVDGGAFAQGDLYSEISDNFFLSNDNSTNNGGNGLWPAHAIVVTNTVLSLHMIRNKLNDNDAAYWFHGQTNMGHIMFNGDTVENSGRNGVTASNIITVVSRGGVTFRDFYMEANQANFAIYVNGAGNVLMNGASLASDYSGTNYTGTLVGLDDVAHATVTQVRFNNTLTNFIGQLNSGIVVAEDCWFDRGTANFPGEATYSEIFARIVGNVALKKGPYFVARTLTGTTPTVNFAQSDSFTITLSGDTTFATSQRYQGARAKVRIVADGSTRALTWPSWKFVGAAAGPANIAANKTATLQLECFGTAETDIAAYYVVEP